MKKLILTAAFALPIISLSFATNASEISSNLIASNIHSGAHPSSSFVRDAVHHFEIDVPKSGLSSLSIELPENISVRDEIEVKNQDGEKINAKVSMNDRKATIAFSQPVPAQTKLLIDLNGVKTPGYANTWNYRIYGTMVGIDREIPLGTRRVQTYDL
ncbi:MAG: DUF2808 domain-containing protein [Hydrococcus sp. Prado102]|jgi:hypothetical protein|nr:DUF2808 domain-containing protein [Hydrococcus sp. Prado102]